MERRFIDLEKFVKRFPMLESNNGDFLVSAEDVRRAIAIASAESGDVVEVVRCKNCKYLTFSDFYGECGRRLGVVTPNGFCSSGERK